MSKQMQQNVATYKYFTIHRQQLVGERRPTYHIINLRSGDQLGWIVYYAPWRQMVFKPCKNTLWSTDCLDNIREFMAQVAADKYL